MRAARYLGDRRVTVQDVPIPSVGPTDVLLAPEFVGVCGTDAHIVDGEYRSAPPVTLGHEIGGRVVEIGSAVRTVRVGDLVSVEPHYYCGVCVHCQSGRVNMCPDRRAPGVHLDGGMAEFLAVDETIAYPVPGTQDARRAALTEPLACAVHGMDRLAPASGSALVVFGVGPVGALLLMLARRAGVGPVVAVEGRSGRRDLAQRVGADIVLDPTEDGLVDRLLEASGGIGFPSAIDAVGSAAVLETAIPALSRGGRLLVFGVAHPDARASISPHDIYARELTILGTALNPFTHRRAANLVHQLPLDELTVGDFPLERFDEALAAQRAGTYDKVFITPQVAR
ncbi:alcohol dehydrogenase catalytic domain-containing protein [Nakamurella flavida]|uniref:Alcohol dehydrogenase catalytic domain-containing protein n=1 Tax=Nakamurella flavida TaxID=363630 RepID=A0A938YEF3_9ACTN|nr:alcohol dehydrogenase catalytic domain-containing protein [Nakamurella flavida]MBM9476151.1 alcohol dehydrogenase catalytic domain-containing protein [Nakamurella flavida]MDP9777104.1 threonine dehydrogenase-like Zn-dependent dehydrogenase [Nakamurella flavida]